VFIAYANLCDSTVIWEFRFSCRDTMNATMRMTKNDVVQKSSQLALPNGMDNMVLSLFFYFFYFYESMKLY